MDPARLRTLKMDLEHLCGLIPSVTPCFPGPRLHADGPQSYDDGDGSFYSEQPTEYGDAEDENAFHEALDANPTDHTTRQVFADWLQDRGDPRAAGYRAMGQLGVIPHRWKGGGKDNWWGFRDAVEQPTDDKLHDEWFGRLTGHHEESRPGIRAYWGRRHAEDAAALAFSQLHPDEQQRILQSAQPQQGNDMPTQNSHYSEYADPAGHPQSQTEIPGQLRPLPRPGGIMSPVGRPAAVTGRPPFRTGPVGALVTGSPRLGHLTRSFRNLLAQLRQRGLYSQYAYLPPHRQNRPVPEGWAPHEMGEWHNPDGSVAGGEPEQEPQGDPVQDFHDAYSNWQSDVRMGHAGPEDEPLPEHFGLNDADVGRYAAYSEFSMPSYPQAQNVGGLIHPAWASMPLPEHALGYDDRQLDENGYPVWTGTGPVHKGISDDELVGNVPWEQSTGSVWGGEAGPAHQPSPSLPPPRPGFGARRPPPPPRQNRNRGAAGMDPNEPQLPYGEFDMPSYPAANNVGGLTHPAWASMPLPQHALGYGELSPGKAREILHDGTVHGHPLTDKQRRFMGWKSHQTNHAAYAAADFHSGFANLKNPHNPWVTPNEGFWHGHAGNQNYADPHSDADPRQGNPQAPLPYAPKRKGRKRPAVSGGLVRVKEYPRMKRPDPTQQQNPQYAAYADPAGHPDNQIWHSGVPGAETSKVMGVPVKSGTVWTKGFSHGPHDAATVGGSDDPANHPEGKAFLDHIRANPDDATTRRVFADWLDDNGYPPDMGKLHRIYAGQIMGEPTEHLSAYSDMPEPTSEYCGMDDGYAPVSADLFTVFTNLAAQLAQIAPGSTSSYCSYNSAEPDPNANLSDARALSGQTGDLSGNSLTHIGYASYDRGRL